MHSNGYKDVLTSKVGLTGPQLTVISITDLIALPGILPANEERSCYMTAFKKNACECHYGIESVGVPAEGP